MGTLTGQDIADRAWTILNDTHGVGGVRWPADECLLWINDAQREVVIVLPSAFVKAAKPALVAGTRQDFAGLNITDGLSVIRIPRNFNAAGNAPGRAITPRPMAWLDEQRPDWHNDTPGPAVHSMHDPNDPKAFYLWPPATAGDRVELVYSAVPPELAAIANTIALDDIYANALQYYLLFRSFGKNANYTKNPALSAAYYQLFLQSLGVKDQRVRAIDPNRLMVAEGASVAAA